MNDNERKIYEKYEAQGYDVIHIGVPDFILLKDGEIEFVEVKKGSDTLNKNQVRAIALLEKHGQVVRVERVPVIHHSPLLEKWRQEQAKPVHAIPRQSNPQQASPNHTSPSQTTWPFQTSPDRASPIRATPHQTMPAQATPFQPRPNPKGVEIVEM